MILKIIQIKSLKDHNETQANLKYWLTRNPKERLEAVEFLRRQLHGNTARLQRVLRIYQK